MTYLIGLIADLVKGHYKKDVSYNIKKYMNVNTFVFNYEYNVAKCKKDFSNYTLIVLMAYIGASLLLLNKVLVPIFEGDKYFRIWIMVLLVLLILIMVIISKKLFRYFLGDFGDLNNVDMTKKEALKKHKDLLAILTYYIISYTLIAISIVTAKTIFLIIPILMFFLMIPVNEIYEKRFQKIQRSVKEYYKDLIIVKTADKINKYKTSETIIQILSNNDLVIIEDEKRYSNLIRANEIKYVKIENDLYYIKDGKYNLKENYFEDKKILKNKNIRLRKKL